MVIGLWMSIIASIHVIIAAQEVVDSGQGFNNGPQLVSN